MEGLSLGAKGLMQNDDLDKSSEERLELFFEFVKKKRDACPDGFEVSIQKEIVAEAERLDIKDKAVIALCEALFDGNILTQIDQHRVLFLRVSLESFVCLHLQLMVLCLFTLYNRFLYTVH